MKKTAVVVFSLGFLFCSTGRTQGVFEREKLPEALSDWVDWVLYDIPNLKCPYVESEPVCLWPGRLALSLDEKGGTFTQDSHADREIPLVLAGNALFWPQDVTVDGKKVPVLERGGLPSVTLPAGDHRIQGRFLWESIPEGIDVPLSSGIIDLVINGKPVAAERDESGRLWLVGTAAREEEEQLTLSVWRKLIDGVPLMLETRISVRASGKAREVTLDAVLPEGFVPLAVAGPLPARLDNSGNLKLQLRPGNHVIEISARSSDSPASIQMKSHEGPWPEREIWVWQSDEKLRQVTVDGALGIDPSRTDLPEEWRAMPAYVLEKAGTLRLTTTRRGETEVPPDQLYIQRELWMDLDQGGYTVRDHITGTLNRSWRLDLEAEGKLGRVGIDGQDQLITESKEGKSGVEIRKGDLDMEAEWHLEYAAGKLPAVGWSKDVMGLSTTLNLPPGWKLLFSDGVDTVANTWWSQWDLFSFFFVLIISIATAKLTRWWWGIVALVGLVLAHHEPDAPMVVWPFLLVVIALLKVLKKGKLRVAAVVLFSATVIWLVLVLVPFDVYQIRNGLYPQAVSQDMGGKGFTGLTFAAKGGMDMNAPPAPPEKAKDEEASIALGQAALGVSPDASLDLLVSRKKGDVRRGLSSELMQNTWQQSSAAQDPRAVVQTGMGVPNWRWNSWSLTWNGPVQKDHHMSLTMMSPKVNLAVSFLRMILLTLIGVILIWEGRRTGRKPEPKNESASPEPAPPATSAPASDAAASGAVGALLVLLSLSALPTALSAEENPDSVSAGMPSDALLSTLRERLTVAPECRPNCISISRLDIVVQNDIASITAEVHAEEASSVIIPGPSENWTPKFVSLDGRPTAAVVQRDDGFLHARVETGIHKLEATGPMPPGGALVLSLGMPPKHVTVAAEGWAVDGLRDNNRAEGSLQFTRMAKSSAEAEGDGTEGGTYPPWLEVTREVTLGIPWTVVTTVRRVSPTGTPVLITVPLLPKESVTDSELKVTAQGVQVSLSRDAESISWMSTLKEQETLGFTAPKEVPWSEIWTVQCSPIWQCVFQGLLPVQQKMDGIFKPSFKPWPGEKMSLKVNKPKGVDGASVTVDSATLRMTPGTRLDKGILTLVVRTSRGGDQKITLPGGATVQSLTLDGRSYPFRQDHGQIVVSLKTGAQQIAVEFQIKEGLRTQYTVPTVNVGGPAANVQVVVELPDERWLIFARGPSWGPAILFWGFLLAVLLAGFLLGRYPESPLRSYQWMLLFAGLTQVPVPVAVIIALWFILIGRRGNRPFEKPWVFNTAQIFLILMTVAAVICIVAAVYTGLAVRPDMQVAGLESSNRHLVWYVDRISDRLPSPSVVSIPLTVWRIVMLAWALWLASSIVKWAPWAWKSFSSGGIWLRSKKTPPAPPEPSHQGKA